MEFVIYAAAQENTEGPAGGRACLVVSPNVKGDVLDILERIKGIEDWKKVNMKALLAAPTETNETRHWEMRGYFPSYEHYIIWLKVGRKISQGDMSEIELHNYLQFLHGAEWDPEKTQPYQKFISMVEVLKDELRTSNIKVDHLSNKNYCELVLQGLNDSVHKPDNRDNEELKHLFSYATHLRAAEWDPKNTALQKKLELMVQRLKRARLAQMITVLPGLDPRT